MKNTFSADTLKAKTFEAGSWRGVGSGSGSSVKTSYVVLIKRIIRHLRSRS